MTDESEKQLLSAVKPPSRRGHNLNGRPAGLKNKLGVSAKTQLEKAFHALGGVAALTKWGKNNPTEFYKLWSKIIPLSVNAKMEFERLIIREADPPPAQVPVIIDGQQSAALPVIDAAVEECNIVGDGNLGV